MEANPEPKSSIASRTPSEWSSISTAVAVSSSGLADSVTSTSSWLGRSPERWTVSAANATNPG